MKKLKKKKRQVVITIFELWNPQIVLYYSYQIMTVTEVD